MVLSVVTFPPFSSPSSLLLQDRNPTSAVISSDRINKVLFIVVLFLWFDNLLDDSPSVGLSDIGVKIEVVVQHGGLGGQAVDRRHVHAHSADGHGLGDVLGLERARGERDDIAARGSLV